MCVVVDNIEHECVRIQVAHVTQQSDEMPQLCGNHARGFMWQSFHVCMEVFAVFHMDNE